jgi:ubiquinone/menaquinone biosynthesis C-methylase UbiE
MKRFRSNSYDACLSIAVLHHISTVQRRKMLIAECLRVIKVGGKALFYAWAQDQTGGHSK